MTARERAGSVALALALALLLVAMVHMGGAR